MLNADQDLQIVEKTVRQLGPVHWSLLLLADPDRSIVAAYLENSKIYCLEYEGRCIGLAVLAAARLSNGLVPPILKDFSLAQEDAELLNIAIDEAWQGRSFARMLLTHCIAQCKQVACQQLWLGTANSSLGPLALYQKLGFRISHVLPDYFLKYPEAMSENGIATRDMLRLRLALQVVLDV